LLAAGFVGFALCLPHLRGTAADLPGGRWIAWSWPPYWGARVLADPIGAWPFAAALAAAAAVLFAVSVALQRAPRPDASRGVGRSWLGRLDRRITGGGPLLGVTAFTSTMLYRSAGFRAKVLPIFGLPVAMIGLALAGAEPRGRVVLIGITLQLPAVYLPLLVGFLAKADQEGGSWVFATSPEGASPELGRRAGLVSLATHVLLPVHAVALVVMVCSGIGAMVSLSLAAFSLGVAVLVAALALRQLGGPAFTDESEGVSVDAGAMLGLAFLLGTGGGAFALVAHQPWAPVLGFAALAAAVVRLRRVGLA
jgi:hypothetical protein